MSNEKESVAPIKDGAANGVDGRRASKKKRKSKADFQIDIRAALEDAVRIKCDGGITSVHPYEAMLRQNVRKALINKCVPSMKLVLGEAEKHKLIKEPPEKATGGIFVVPKELPEDLQRKIFDDPDYGSGQQTSMSSIWWHVLSVVSFERFLECFNGRKNRNDGEAAGYRRPPTASQFKKGQSGNPGGRPPKTAGHRSIAVRVLGEIQRLPGKPKGARVRYTMLELIVKTLKQLTATGHAAATTLYLKCVARHGTQQASDQPIGYIVLPEALTREEWEARYSPKDDPPGDGNDID